MNITIFGSAAPLPPDPLYQAAYRLGRRLGEAGHTVITGGYVGTMEAVSKGAYDAGAHVIGVTCAEIERYRPGTANAWVKEVRPTLTLSQRIQTMLDDAQAVIALPGGPGTLAEISLAWNRLVINSLPRMPLILVGEGWRAAFGGLFNSMEVQTSQDIRSLLTFVHSADQAVEALTSSTIPTNQ